MPALKPYDLPEHLAERVHVRQDAPLRGARVVYWMRTAARGHENPALDVARHLSAKLGLPLLVYQGLDERHPYANSRLHHFILEGAKEVARELREAGVSHALHVSRPGHRAPALRLLARSAAVVVTERMPVPPLPQWTDRLAEEGTPVWEVDTACVVPMGMLQGRIDRAFRFRQAAEPYWEKRLTRAWPDAPAAAADPLSDLPFDPVDPHSTDLRELVSACEIDHTVGRVLDTPGGSGPGYARWRAFRRHGLAHYARRRNNAALDGVSRMSAYLHFGQVSPFRIAREAAADGADKFLDELLVWRELAYHWCATVDNPDAWRALPGWARHTLDAHRGDPREHVPELRLTQGRTGDPLWDASQDSLRIHGELHNNVRMTWGKALLRWSSSPELAHRRLIALNHRYALDGRDPASYGGLLWCLGAFDRPFTPEVPILGTVRPRPLEDHARRLNVDAFATRARRPRRALPRRTLILGGGFAGATCARVLADHGEDVWVADKGRGPGGRLATRRADLGTFNHGAPAFAPRDPTLRRWAASWAEDGVVVPVTGQVGRWRAGSLTVTELPVGAYRGSPGTNAVVRALLDGVAVRWQTAATRITHTHGQWQVFSGDAQIGEAERLVLAIPAPQAAALLEPDPALAALARQARQATMSPRWVVMARVTGTPPDVVHLDLDHPVLAAASRQDDPTAWVLRATEAWSLDHLEDARDEVVAALTSAWREVSPGCDVVDAAAHRWRYALTTSPVGAPILTDAARGLVVAGDWLLGDGVTHAFRSGSTAAGWLLAEP